MKSLGTLALAAAVSLSMGCKSKDEKGGDKTKPNKPVAPATDKPVVKKPARPAAKPIAEAAVKKLMDGWLKAQNDGDFAAYQAVFAKRMTGVKKIGSRTSRYNREGWIKDRKRMFKRKMVVGASNVMITASAHSVVVRFTQTWESGKFKDVGPKQLIIVREGKDLRIAREEMLQSVVMSSWRKGARLPQDRFAFVIKVAKKNYVVVAKGAEDDWSKGAINVAEDDGVMKAMQKADMSKLPAPVKAWHRRKVSGIASGKACDAVLGDLYVLSGVSPHFGARQNWRGEMGDPPASKDEIADAVKGMVPSEDRWVLASISGCNAAWVRASSKDTPSQLATKKDPALSKSAVAAFRKLSGWKAIQKFWASEATAKGKPWDEGPTTKVFEDAKRNTRYVFVWATVGDGCGQFEGTLWALFSADASGKLTLLTDPKDPGVMGFTPTEGWDLDGNGDVGFIGSGNVVFGGGPVLIRYTKSKKRYEAARDIEFSYQDCPC